nr:endonuclease/exonuclease/phosphatase family protein [Roseibium sp. RKSG952]
MESFGGTRLDADLLQPRIKALRPRLQDLEADILCLQEVNAQKPQGATVRDFSALEMLLKETCYADYHMAYSTREEAPVPGDRHNLVLLSRFPVSACRALYQEHMEAPFWQPGHADPPQEAPEPVRFERPLLQAQIDLGAKGTLHVFGVHLRAPIAAPIPGGKLSAQRWKSVPSWAEGYFLSAVKRAAQALDLRLAVDRVLDANPDAFVLAAGDFNATSDASALRLVRADCQETGNPDLEDRQLFQIDALLPQKERATILHGGRGRTFDHILVSQALKARFSKVEIFNSDLADELFDAGTDAENASFHAAVCAEFAL